MLTEKYIQQKLAAYRGWEYTDFVIAKTYHFASFMVALELVNVVAVIAQNFDCFPRIAIVQNTVTFTITPEKGSGYRDIHFQLLSAIEQQAVSFV